MSPKNLNAKIKIPKLLKIKLNNKKISQIFKKFEKSLIIKENFIVAVSGGPDSLALAYLAKIYALKNNLIVKFIIIDHKLRSESTKEAKKVKKILKNFYIESKILTWLGPKPDKNIQSFARKERYKLLFKECKKYEIRNILLAHHRDDLLENFFIRMLRGSGLKGLISLNKKTNIDNINLLRPLLDQKKEDLIFLSKKVFNFFVIDPTNKDDKYQRVKIRNLIIELKNNGLDMRKFLKTIKNLQDSDFVVNFYVNRNLEKNSFFSLKNKKLILNSDFFQQPYEIIFRSFSETINSIGKKYYPPRGKKLDRLIRDIKKNRSFRATLGGCVIEKVNQTVIISKEG